MQLVFTESAWEDYLYWQKVDRKGLSHINKLIKECCRSPFTGTGKPEPLKFELSGCWSRRIDFEHRLVYKIVDEKLIIIQCRYHY
jgi:toxin YoeB